MEWIIQEAFQMGNGSHYRTFQCTGGISHLPKFYWLRILKKVSIPFLTKCHLVSRGKQYFRAFIQLVQVFNFIGVTGHAN